MAFFLEPCRRNSKLDILLRVPYTQPLKKTLSYLVPGRPVLTGGAVLSKNSKRILLVDDDHALSEMIQRVLEREGYDVKHAETSAATLDLLNSWRPHAIILDILLRGDENGLDLLARLREKSSVAIIMLSGYAEELTKIRALGMGADDFVSKPFSSGELMARLQTIFRRVPDLDHVSFADLKLDLAAHRVHRSGTEIALTRKEFQILACLARHPESILSAQAILREAWGPQFVHYIQTLRVHIGNLRKKLGRTPWGSDYIRTVPGVGYGLEMNPERLSAKTR